MVTLALDTTGRPGSVALTSGGRLLAERAGDPARSHGERLPGEIAALAAEFDLELRAIELYAVAAGPGSFTGLRVGIATIQGLALANGRRVVPVSALEALAHHAAPSATGLVAAWIDAGRGEIFASLYSIGPSAGGEAAACAGRREIEPPSVGRPQEVLAAWRRRWHDRHDAVVFAGNGALVHRACISGELSGRARILEPAPLLAAAIAEIAVERAGRGGAMAPHAVAPLYVRRPDAELARERKAKR